MTGKAADQRYALSQIVLTQPKLPEMPGVVTAKVRRGSRNFLEEPAMTSEELESLEEPFASITQRPGARVVIDLTGVEMVTTPAFWRAE